MVKTKHHEAIPMPGTFPNSKTIPSLKSNKNFGGLGTMGSMGLSGSSSHLGQAQPSRLPSLSDLNPTTAAPSLYPSGLNALSYQKAAIGLKLC